MFVSRTQFLLNKNKIFTYLYKRIIFKNFRENPLHILCDIISNLLKMPNSNSPIVFEKINVLKWKIIMHFKHYLRHFIEYYLSRRKIKSFQVTL